MKTSPISVFIYKYLYLTLLGHLRQKVYDLLQSFIIDCRPLFFLFEIIQIPDQAPWPFKWCISDYVLFLIDLYLLIRYIQCHYSTHSRYWNENDFTVDKIRFFCHFILTVFFFLIYFRLCFIFIVLWRLFLPKGLLIS